MWMVLGLRSDLILDEGNGELVVGLVVVVV